MNQLTDTDKNFQVIIYWRTYLAYKWDKSKETLTQYYDMCEVHQENLMSVGIEKSLPANDKMYATLLFMNVQHNFKEEVKKFCTDDGMQKADTYVKAKEMVNT